MSFERDEIRKAELIRKCLAKNNCNDGKGVRGKLDKMRSESRGQDKVLLNMLLND